MDCSLPGSSIHGGFQARVLEWGAIAFSSWWLRMSIKETFLFKNQREWKAMHVDSQYLDKGPAMNKRD